MGLDMYFYKRKHFFDVSEITVKHKKNFDKDAPVEEYKSTEPTDCAIIQTEMGYLRKANWIHYWIVNNKARGVDDCKAVYLSSADIEELLDVCEDALESKNPSDVLPTHDGFFFGPTDYDDWYIEQTQRAVEILKGIIDEYKKDPSMDVIYEASW